MRKPQVWWALTEGRHQCSLQVVESEGGGLPGVSEQERLAAERAIACQLLPVTYDGSPLVRAELAAALARFAAGHAVLFKVPSPSC